MPEKSDKPKIPGGVSREAAITSQPDYNGQEQESMPSYLLYPAGPKL